MSHWFRWALLVMLLFCKAGFAQEKYPAVLQKLREKYEPLRAQHESQRLAIKKLQEELINFPNQFLANGDLEARNPFASNATEDGSVIPPKTAGVTAGVKNAEGLPIPSDEDALFDLSQKTFPRTGGMGGNGPLHFANHLTSNDQYWPDLNRINVVQSAQRLAFAKEVSENLTRNDLEQIVEYCWDLRREDYFNEFALRVAVEIALRETNNSSLRSILSTHPMPNFGPFVLELFHDERSFRMHCRMLLAKPYRPMNGFLMGYDVPADFRASVRRELGDVEKVLLATKDPLLAERKWFLNGLMASWDYVDSLDPIAKKHYQDFERRFYACESISPPDHNKSLLNYLGYGAYFFRWKEGDSVFLLHKLEAKEMFYFDHALAQKIGALHLNAEESAKLKQIQQKKK